MILKMSYTGKDNTVYKCDRCKRIIDTGKDRRIRIAAQISTHSKYKTLNSWDFCERCYAALKRGIERGVVKE